MTTHKTGRRPRGDPARWSFARLAPAGNIPRFSGTTCPSTSRPDKSSGAVRIIGKDSRFQIFVNVSRSSARGDSPIGLYRASLRRTRLEVNTRTLHDGGLFIRLLLVSFVLHVFI